MRGRRLLAIPLFVLGAIPALIALIGLWILVSNWFEPRQQQHAVVSGSTITGRTSTTHVVMAIGFPGGEPIGLEPWQLMLLSGAIAGVCFGGGWALLRDGGEHDE